MDGGLMKELVLKEINQYVNENIVDFHKRRIMSIENMTLNRLLKKNPYLFKAKNITNAGDLIKGLMDAFLSSSEEKLFGDFLEGLAIYIAQKTCNGHKSSAQGVDLELINNDIHYVISVKSGPNWGNSSQYDALELNLKNCVTRIKQSRRGINVQPVLGICYGKTKTSYIRGFLKVVGQNFWYLISEDKDLYTDIIEPIGYRAKEHNEAYYQQKDALINQYAKLFIERFCNEKGIIDWVKVVQFNSHNYDLDKIL
jgi:hypothetical protein